MRVLFLTHRLPFPPDRGDRIRAFQIVRALSRWADVELVSLTHDEAEAARADDLRACMNVGLTTVPVPYYRTRLSAVGALAGTTPLTHVLLDSPEMTPALRSICASRPPDVVLAYCSGMAKFAMQPPLSAYPLVIDLVDLDSAKWAEMSAESRLPMAWIYGREARHLGSFERDAVERAHACLVVNDREADAVRGLCPNADVRVVGNGISLDRFAPPGPPSEEPRVVFCGVMDYGPNVDGVVWFAREVWPRVLERCPAATLSVVGSNPTDAVRRLAGDAQRIEVTGRVPEVTPYLWRSAVSIAPLRIARGLQNKVLEATAAGLPSVVTSAVFDGLPNEVRSACAVADDAEAFAGETVRLLGLAAGERRAIPARSDFRSLSWEQQMRPLAAILTNAALSGSRAVSAC
jgi:sugar transferase (PEP-CTERM/EpsH1 system associated)